MLDTKDALRLAIGALTFYGNPGLAHSSHSKPEMPSVATVDGGMLARMTLANLDEHLDDDARCELRRCQEMARVMGTDNARN